MHGQKTIVVNCLQSLTLNENVRDKKEVNYYLEIVLYILTFLCVGTFGAIAPRCREDDDDAIGAKVPKDVVVAIDDEYREDIGDATAAKAYKGAVDATAAMYHEDAGDAIVPKVQRRIVVDHDRESLNSPTLSLILYSLCNY
ncbi:hypothetical protein KW850_04505 [Bacillus sp. sid0103]|uniref:hypothetical protein n=1 Tax=Bacillus sp. sid0103 TaxID=2856337 RepID=UPI001C485021|nr:hypothetical protein [Bacillus sp. sid0103]MBV7504527.1 hypothetical protein [Bacillus sp. sid0103]